METDNMTEFNLHTLDTAPIKSRPLLEGAKQAYGFIPNLYAGQAEHQAC